MVLFLAVDVCTMRDQDFSGVDKSSSRGIVKRRSLEHPTGRQVGSICQEDFNYFNMVPLRRITDCDMERCSSQAEILIQIGSLGNQSSDLGLVTTHRCYVESVLCPIDRRISVHFSLLKRDVTGVLASNRRRGQFEVQEYSCPE